MTDHENDEPDFESLSEEARTRLVRTEEALRLMGRDEDTIISMRKGMFDLYDPATGEFNVRDFEMFEEALMPTLLGSPIMKDTLACRELLDEPELKRLWFTAEQLQPCMDECDAWLGDQIELEDNPNVAEMFLDESRTDERAAMGEILFRHYELLVTPELERQVYEALFRLSKSRTGEAQRLAKIGMTTFTRFPGRPNPFLQFLFVKSFIFNTDLTEDLPEIVEDEEQLQYLLAEFEDSLYAILAGGEGFPEDLDDEDREEF